jgi:hypothetical protein
MRTKQQPISSVNFVPPLIQPWDYDPEKVRATVASAIAASEDGADEDTGSGTTGASPPAATASPTVPTPTSSTPAVMERPGSDPDANTSDLAQVCSAG